MKRAVSLILAAVIFLSLALLSSCGGMKRYSYADITVFDTHTTILGYDKNEAAFDEKAELIMERLTYYHRQYDIYHEYEGINNLKTVNDNAGVAPVTVDEAIIELLLFSKEMYELTGGKTNVAMGSVLSVWHEYRTAGLEAPESARLPGMEELSAAALHTDIGKVLIDEEAQTVYLEDSEMSLDVGAVAKGYAVEKTAEFMEEQGFSGYALSVGGNVRCVGAKAGGEKWEVGVQNPDMSSDEAYFATVYLTSEALVTSGTYQRYYTVDGVDYHHIIDPDTLMPKNTFASVSVICADSGIADALSTALFNMTYDEGAALCASLTEVDAAWVYPDGRVEMTEGFEKMKNEK